MNILIIYDSQYGNTEQIARSIANELAKSDKVDLVHVAKTSYIGFKGVDLFIIGSPTQKWRPTPIIRSFLENIPEGSLNGLPAAVFDTRLNMTHWVTGSAAEMVAKKLEAIGASLILPPESFLVKGMKGPLADKEVERAKEWARVLIEKLKEFKTSAEKGSV